MKVLIVSDTHKRNDNFFHVMEMVGPIDMVIHCGDIEGSEYAIEAGAGCPVEMVAGNNDFFSDLPMEREFELGQYKVWVTHGHHYYVSMGNERLKQEARSRGVDIVFYGHTHRPDIDLEDDKSDNLFEDGQNEELDSGKTDKSLAHNFYNHYYRDFGFHFIFYPQIYDFVLSGID